MTIIQVKVCCFCKQEKLLTAFNKNKSKKDGFQVFCRECGHNYYKKHKTSIKRNSVNQRKEYIKARMIFVLTYLKSKGCIDCGENDPVVLEFDHVRGVKINTISRMVQACANMKTIQEEISKCDVRCANCHKKKTAIQLGFYKDIDLSKI